MIRCITGKPGHGKSLFMLWEMLQYVLKGWTVATNMTLTDDCPFAHRVIRLDVDGWPVFQMPEKAVGKEGDGNHRPEIPYDAFWHYMPYSVAYFLDEYDNQLDSMDFVRLAEAARDARLYHKQHRKRSDVVIYSVQNIDNIWNRVRRMTETFTVCTWNYRTSSLFGTWLPITWSSFMRQEFADDQCKQLVAEGRFWYGEAAPMFKWYNTSQLVGDPRFYGWAGPEGDQERFARALAREGVSNG